MLNGGACRTLILNSYWYEPWKQERCSFLVPPRCIFYKPHWAWQGVKLTRLMSIFTSKVWKFFIISAGKIWSKPGRDKSIIPHANYLVLMYLLSRVIEGDKLHPSQYAPPGLSISWKMFLESFIFRRVLDYYFEVPTKRPIFEGLFTKTLWAKKP